MTKENFFSLLSNEIQSFNNLLATENGDWIVKGFIDIYKRIYSITNDTKVVSKIIEILLIPSLDSFAQKNGLELILPKEQNFYPDMTFKDNEGNLFAVDFKSTIRNSKNKIKSLTLGAFSGYFRDRSSTKNTTFPYGNYKCHLVLGVIYTQVKNHINEKEVYSLDNFNKIKSVIKDFQFFLQPKYKIASDTAGSGNTKNIGSVTDLDKLINGKGIFADLGEEVFDDYWIYYMNGKDAKEFGLEKPPYNNLTTYMEYKKKTAKALKIKNNKIK
jgi:hypothetical protein